MHVTFYVNCHYCLVIEIGVDGDSWSTPAETFERCALLGVVAVRSSPGAHQKNGHVPLSFVAPPTAMQDEGGRQGLHCARITLQWGTALCVYLKYIWSRNVRSRKRA